jgi:hypothetical protein
MSFHGPPRHFQLNSNLSIVAALQKQFDNLLFARTQSMSRLIHPNLLSVFAFASPPQPWVTWLNLSNCHSNHIAILRRLLSVTYEQQFPQALAEHRTTIPERGGYLPKTVRTFAANDFPLSKRPKTL